MPSSFDNPYLGQGIAIDTPLARADATRVGRLLAQCPHHAATPLRDLPGLAQQCGVAAIHLKDESARMGLGSFKALGAAFVIACDAADHAAGEEIAADELSDRTYVAASAGNHGLSVAAGAAVFGARAVIYLADTVPEAFAERLRSKGAEVVRAGETYEESMAAAERAAAERGWTLLSDSSWPGYTEIPLGVMEGYLQMAREAVDQMPEPPSHILLQAGVGGLAAAVARYARAQWGDGPEIIVVEPAYAPALIESVRAGRLVTTEGPVSEMGRLDCKTPSMIALASLSRDANRFVTISEEEAAQGVEILKAHGFATTPSGGAGMAALIAGLEGLGAEARVLAILSEGPEDG
ncbi:pyridoxal-phosphate dependent enzyme [Thalassovita aquimarina]|uniref:Pyridoxal-phosphate dependent enzyme n=1 Tax=Thalassovita aquimarina TaxID=2785917 RepID=A0ABS5HRI9_9RHOB|nr:pyridoxal-phosphate dependent enzyme [Thalassovita aquimarina]MBR9651591.1 pyridoxal-phosphate dependent enzyme [Thalassovita aquimarina]